VADLQSQDYIRISASTLTPPSARDHEQEVAKLIDVSRCIGCKACQAACMEWNDLRNEVGHFEGSYDNPADLDPSTRTLMRFTEYENEQVTGGDKSAQGKDIARAKMMSRAVRENKP